jgi:hypothetical protein
MLDIKQTLRTIFTFHWNPGLDLVAVLVSWVLVTGTLFTATVIVTADAGGGLPYFLLYAILGATLFGVGMPLAWMVVYRKRPIQDLGLTTKYLGVSIVLQLVFAALQYIGTLAQVEVPVLREVAPLLALALAIGFFEALFWRGWVFWRLEEAFGLIPAVLVGSLLCHASRRNRVPVPGRCALCSDIPPHPQRLYPLAGFAADGPTGDIAPRWARPSLACLGGLPRSVGRDAGPGLAGESHVPQTPGAQEAASHSTGMIRSNSMKRP